MKLLFVCVCVCVCVLNFFELPFIKLLFLFLRGRLLDVKSQSFVLY